MRALPLTVLHAVQPTVASWPLGPMHGGITQWQKDEATRILDSAERILDDLSPAQRPAAETQLLHGGPVTDWSVRQKMRR